MASRLLHLAVSCELEKLADINDSNRFRLGHILPDAMVTESKFDYNTHFARLTPDKTKKVMDFGEFFVKFQKEILSDGLYLGYYFHLIEDVIFRNMLYYDLGLLKYRNNKEFLKSLYRDYAIVGIRLTEKYNIKSSLEIPENFKKERIFEIAPFEAEAFLEELEKDFSRYYTGEPEFFGYAQGDSFISKCTRVCFSEYNALKNGGHAVFAEDFFWDNANAE